MFRVAVGFTVGLGLGLRRPKPSPTLNPTASLNPTQPLLLLDISVFCGVYLVTIGTSTATSHSGLTSRKTDIFAMRLFHHVFIKIKSQNVRTIFDNLVW